MCGPGTPRAREVHAEVGAGEGHAGPEAARGRAGHRSWRLPAAALRPGEEQLLASGRGRAAWTGPVGPALSPALRGWRRARVGGHPCVPAVGLRRRAGPRHAALVPCAGSGMRASPEARLLCGLDPRACWKELRGITPVGTREACSPSSFSHPDRLPGPWRPDQLPCV